MADYRWDFDEVTPPWEVARREKEAARKQEITDLGFNIFVVGSPGYMGSTIPIELYVCQECRAVVDHAALHREVCEI